MSSFSMLKYLIVSLFSDRLRLAQYQEQKASRVSYYQIKLIRKFIIKLRYQQQKSRTSYQRKSIPHNSRSTKVATSPKAHNKYLS